MSRMDAMPFEIDLKQRMRLTDQLADGFRRAILTGVYREGAALPPLREVCERFGVSMIVARAAYRRLGEEGLTVSRQRIGCIVAPKNVKLWKGRVLVVSRYEDGSYYVNTLVDELRDRFAESGYVLTQVLVKRGLDGRHDLSHLEFALGETVSLVIQLFRDTDISRFLARRRVPFVTVGWAPSVGTGSLGDISFDFAPALGELIRAAKKARVRSVLQIGVERHPWSARAFASAGLELRERTLKPKAGRGLLEGTVVAAMEFFERGLAQGRAFPDLVYFTDDYVAQGALIAFAHQGVGIPEKLRVVSVANAGLGPVWWKPLTHIELDPRAHGRQIASAVARLLADGRFPPDVRLRPVYISGSTL